MSVSEGQTPATELDARPTFTGADYGLSRTQMSRLVNEIWAMTATTGTPLRRQEVRDRIRAHASQGRTAAEILHGARNAYGIVDPTGETAARNLDAAARRARSRNLCPDGCLTPDECKANRPVPDVNGHCCAAYGRDELARGMGCPRHNLNRAWAQVNA